MVNHSFLQICSKHLFSTIELHDEPDPTRKKYTTLINGFVKLLKKQTRCHRVDHIRKLTYRIGLGARCLQTIFIIFRPALTHPKFPPNNSSNSIVSQSPLNICMKRTWNTLEFSLTSALLHLMHLPTINHIEISFIPLSSDLTSSDNLHRVNISHLFDTEGEAGSVSRWTEYCRMPSWLKNSIYQLIVFAVWWDFFPPVQHFKGPWFDSQVSFFGVFRGLRGIGSDGGT